MAGTRDAKENHRVMQEDRFACENIRSVAIEEGAGGSSKWIAIIMKTAHRKAHHMGVFLRFA
jgi:hypothetical protein